LEFFFLNKEKILSSGFSVQDFTEDKFFRVVDMDFLEIKNISSFQSLRVF
jgi:hypothetical protein